MNEIEYELRDRDLLAFSEHQVSEHKVLKKRLHRHQVTIPAFLVAIALLLLFYYKDMVSAAYVGVIALVWGFLIPAYLKWHTRKQLRSMYTDEDKQRLLGRYRLAVARDALIEQKLGGEEIRIPWKEVLRIDVADKYVFIVVGISEAIVVPQTGIKKSQLGDFVKAANERVAAAD